MTLTIFDWINTYIYMYTSTVVNNTLHNPPLSHFSLSLSLSLSPMMVFVLRTVMGCLWSTVVLLSQLLLFQRWLYGNWARGSSKVWECWVLQRKWQRRVGWMKETLNKHIRAAECKCENKPELNTLKSIQHWSHHGHLWQKTSKSHTVWCSPRSY